MFVLAAGFLNNYYTRHSAFLLETVTAQFQMLAPRAGVR